MDPAHPLRVALGQVVVRGDDVHALALQGVQVRRHGGGEGLALTGLHLGDVALVQGDGAQDLHVERPLADGPAGSLPDHREHLGEQVVDPLAALHPALELVGLAPQLVVGELLDLRLERVHEPDAVHELLDLAPFAGGEDLVEYHGMSF